MGGGLPAISGPELAVLLESDGWMLDCRSTHGLTYKKIVAGRLLITTIPSKKRPLCNSTLHQILGVRQTRLGRAGLLRLLRK
jgi:hypothetical protein